MVVGSTLVAAQVTQQWVVLVQAAEAGAQCVRRPRRGGGLSTATALSASASSTLATGPTQAQVLTKLAVDQVPQIGRI